MKFPRVPEVLKEAKARGVGVIAMKTLAGARDMDLDSKGSPFEQVAFKWVLRHTEVSGLVVTFKRIRQLDEFLPASGQSFTALDHYTLDRCAALYGSDYCRTGCSDCESGCPLDVPIATILRYQMYFESHEEEKRAMRSYTALDLNAERCLSCGAETCVDHCPHRLPVAHKLRASHQLMTFSALA